MTKKERKRLIKHRHRRYLRSQAIYISLCAAEAKLIENKLLTRDYKEVAAEHGLNPGRVKYYQPTRKRLVKPMRDTEETMRETWRHEKEVKKTMASTPEFESLTQK